MLGFAAVLTLLAPQDPAAALAAERARVALVARCAPAVCSVMAMDAPGGGSGVVFHPMGYVLTNYHVVGEPRKSAPGTPRVWQNKKVGMPDGQLYEAVVLGIDPGSDLAVLRLLPRQESSPQHGHRWPSCEIGDSDRLMVGDHVLAMGNPFLLATDFQPTVTFGIVSGLHRYQEGERHRLLVYPDCIQTDAAVNPGNSGGPLFDERGQIVGINGRIAVGDRGRVNAGVGFAIASNQIRNFLGDLLAGRHAEHGTLDLSAWFRAEDEGPDRPRGVFVQQLFKDSVAANAGVQLGDQILALDSVPVHSANQFATMVGVLPAGTFVELTFRSPGAARPKTATIRLARLDTGSSFDGATPRLASADERTLAARAFCSTEPGSNFPFLLRPDGAIRSTTRTADGFVLTIGSLQLCRRSPGPAVEAITLRVDGEPAGPPRPATVEEAELLYREERLNAFAWPHGGHQHRLADARLLGGVHVHGEPAFRYELPGVDGETWFFLDGRPAGFCYRDPLRRAEVAFHLRAERLLVVVDGAPEPGWSIALPPSAPVSPPPPPPPPPLTPNPLAARFADVQSSVVKIHGASGLATIQAYAAGIVVSERGHILTLDQVLLQHERTRVVLADGSVHLAKLLPPDERLGVRLLQIDTRGLAAPLRPVWPPSYDAAAQLAAPGRTVLSLGNCFRLAEFNEAISATFGIVVGATTTALRHRLADVHYDGTILLTDASNNPGHYGGGLFDLDGRWLGLNLRLLDSTETNTLLSAAIPSWDLLPYLEQYVLGRTPPPAPAVERRPVFTGIVLFESAGRRSPPAYVERVLPGSPAAALGLRADDLVVRIDDFVIRSCKEMRDVFERCRPGQTVRLSWKRGSAVLEGELLLAEEPAK
jgi:S1-C subfamily serine protease